MADVIYKKINEFVADCTAITNIMGSYLYGIDSNGASVKIAVETILGSGGNYDEVIAELTNKCNGNATAISSLQTALSGKAAAVHTHAISDVSGLQSALDGKAAAVHTHGTTDISGLEDRLQALESGASGSDDDIAALSRRVATNASDISYLASAQNNLANGLSQANTNITALQDAVSDVQIGVATNAAAILDLDTKLDGKAAAVHTHAIDDVTNLRTELDDLDTRIDNLEGRGSDNYVGKADDLAAYGASDGDIVMFVGESGNGLEKGQFYQYNATAGTWSQIDVQPHLSIASGDNFISIANKTLSSTIDIGYNSTTQRLELKGKGDTVVSYVDMSQFIVDGMLDNVQLYTTAEQGVTVEVPYLKFTFNVASGKSVIRVSLKDLVDIYDGANINLTSAFVKAATYSAPAIGDSMDTAIGKLLKGHEDNAAAISGKQDALTFDDAPQSGSNRPVTSQGIKAAIDAAVGNVPNSLKQKDLTTYQGSDGEIVQHTGATTAEFINGYVYKKHGNSGGGTITTDTASIRLDNGTGTIIDTATSSPIVDGRLFFNLSSFEADAQQVYSDYKGNFVLVQNGSMIYGTPSWIQQVSAATDYETISAQVSGITSNVMPVSYFLNNGYITQQEIDELAPSASWERINVQPQTDISGKQDTITGAASTITTANLTASKVLGSDANGKVAATSIATTDAEDAIRKRHTQNTDTKIQSGNNKVEVSASGTAITGNGSVSGNLNVTGDFNKFVLLTVAEYNALATKDATKLYLTY